MPHIKACISLCKDKPFLSEYSEISRVDMAAKFAMTFAENGLRKEATELVEKELEARMRTLGSKQSETLVR